MLASLTDKPVNFLVSVFHNDINVVDVGQHHKYIGIHCPVSAGFSSSIFIDDCFDPFQAFRLFYDWNPTAATSDHDGIFDSANEPLIPRRRSSQVVEMARRDGTTSASSSIPYSQPSFLLLLLSRTSRSASLAFQTRDHPLPLPRVNKVTTLLVVLLARFYF